MTDLLSGVKSGGQLLSAWVFPSAIALAVLYLIALVPTGLDVSLGLRGRPATDLASVLAVASSAIGLAMSALSTPLYRLLEGYLWPKRLQASATARQLKRRAVLQRLADSDAGGVAMALAAEALHRFPQDEAQVAPTSLGNAMRAFETYGVQTYRLDSQTFWTQLVAVVPDSLRREVLGARVTVDLCVALVYDSLAVGILSLAVGVAPRGGPHLGTSALGIFVALSAFIWYRAAVSRCAYWDSAVRALVDMGHVPLAAALGLTMPRSIEKERQMWTLMAQLSFYPYDPTWAVQIDEFRSGQSADTPPESLPARPKEPPTDEQPAAQR
jgi:hypothetical protein